MKDFHEEHTSKICDIFFCEYVDAYLLSVVDDVPKVFEQLVCIIYTSDGQVSIVLMSCLFMIAFC